MPMGKAAALLHSLAMHCSKNKQLIVKLGAIPALVRLVDTHDYDDESDVDVGAVEAMLEQRSRFRERRMWNVKPHTKNGSSRDGNGEK